MSVVLRAVAFAGIHLGEGEVAHAGDYLVSFDVDARGGRGEAVWSPDIRRAMRFPSAGAAMDLWKRQSRVRPFRDDGKPNRPLTAYTVEGMIV